MRCGEVHTEAGFDCDQTVISHTRLVVLSNHTQLLEQVMCNSSR